MATHSPPQDGSLDEIGRVLEDTFRCLLAWCSLPDQLLGERPAYEGAWSAAEHLEHVGLVNHFLLLTIGKGVATALRRAVHQPVPPGDSDLSRLAPIADPTAFSWEPPVHMVPQGGRKPEEVREQLAGQNQRCRELLELMLAGEGRLCSFRMSVHRLGRLDMYQWLYFLAQHGRWHLEFLQRRERGEA